MSCRKNVSIKKQRSLLKEKEERNNLNLIPDKNENPYKRMCKIQKGSRPLYMLQEDSKPLYNDYYDGDNDKSRRLFWQRNNLIRSQQTNKISTT